MSSTVLEVIRLNQELSERLELAFGEELDKKASGQRHKVLQQHRLKSIGDRIVSTNEELIKLQLDSDGILQDELNKMQTGSISAFYDSLNSTLEYYAKFSGQASAETSINYMDSIIQNINEPNFSGEEIFGKYLDLHQHFQVFCNIMKKNAVDQDYLQYLDRFNQFFYIKNDVKASKPYLEYLRSLWGYLENFYYKINPLVDFLHIVSDWEKEFEQKVTSGEIQIRNGGSHSGKGPEPLRLGMFASPQELEALGMERLKEALESLGLKCGGTLQDRAARLWSVRGKKPEEIPAKLKTRNISTVDASLEVHLLEFKIVSISEILADVISATRRHAEKQQARSVEEKEMEIMEEEFGLLPSSETKKEDEDEDDDGPMYNPLNLPIGWDGKPIPYWLYKLHGLGVEYKCEVCGNQSYWGRRAFDRHFQEWKHSYGMRCLGVPNTKHFHDITNIDDVLTLYHKIKDQLRQEQYISEFEEEFEDTQGNILNRRTYEDLARQGLL